MDHASPEPRLVRASSDGVTTTVAADAPSQPPDFASTYLFGNWGGARDSLFQKGVELDADYEGELAHNATGGVRRTEACADRFHLGAKLDLAKLWGWQGASFHLSIHQRNDDQSTTCFRARKSMATVMWRD